MFSGTNAGAPLRRSASAGGYLGRCDRRRLTELRGARRWAERMVAPQGIGHFDTRVAALPDQGRVGFALVREGLLAGVKIFLVTQEPRPSVWSRLVGPPS